MDRFETLRAFAAAARTGSFASAGRLLGLSRDQVSKQVRELERRLKTPLLHRSTRELHLTAEGAAYAAAVLPTLEALERAEQEVTRPSEQPSGTLRVSAPLSYGVRVLSALSIAFLDKYPQIQIHLDLDDRHLATLPPESDLAIRIAGAVEKGVATESIGTVSRGLYASPRYFDRRDVPRDPAELRDHACLHYANLATGRQWVLKKGGRSRRFEIDGRLTCNAGLGLEVAVRKGAGIAILPDFLADQPSLDGPLTRVLPDWSPLPLVVFAILPSTRAVPSTARIYCEFLRRQLKGAR